MLSLKKIFKADTEIQALVILVHNWAKITHLASKVLLYQFLLTHHPYHTDKFGGNNFSRS